MKKICSIITLILIIITISAPVAFAAGLELVDTYPKDGGTGFEPINLMVKLTFSDNVGEENLQATNSRAFKVTDQSGKSVPFKTLYNPEDNTKISLLMSGDLIANTEYKVTIASELSSASGQTLAEAKVITFKTRDVAKDSQISTIMMFVMVGAMVLYSTWDAKRKAKKEAESRGGKVNPYKVAKEKGVSVEKVVAGTDNKKDKAKAKDKGTDKSKDSGKVIGQTGGKVKGIKPKSLKKK
jgi:hypothetical protein